MADPLDPADLERTIREGRSGDPGFSAAMPSFGPGQLSDQSLPDVVSYVIDSNKKGAAGLGPVELGRSAVLWVTIATAAMVPVVYLLARYNMRWVERRAAARRESGRDRWNMSPSTNPAL